MSGDKNVQEKTRSLTWRDMDSSTFTLYSTLYILFVDVVLYPADLLTTRLQADKFTDQRNVRVWPLTKNILKREGFHGLFRGFGVATLGSFPGQFSYFLTYEYANQMFQNLLQTSSGTTSFATGNIAKEVVCWLASPVGLVANAAAGVVAEAVSAISYLPTDIVSQRLQIEQSVNFLHLRFQNTNALSILKTIWKSEGIRGYFRGYGAYLIVFGPQSAVWWASYEACKHGIFRTYGLLRMINVQERPSIASPLTALNHLVSGSVAGVASCLATNPLDVARTRLQLFEVQDPRERANLRRGYWHILRQVYRNEGLHGMFKGMRPRIYVKVPGSALAFLGYEYLKEASMTRPHEPNKIDDV